MRAAKELRLVQDLMPALSSSELSNLGVSGYWVSYTVKEKTLGAAHSSKPLSCKVVKDDAVKEKVQKATEGMKSA